jgi:hypothetical protein
MGPPTVSSGEHRVCVVLTQRSERRRIHEERTKLSSDSIPGDGLKLSELPR